MISDLRLTISVLLNRFVDRLIYAPPSRRDTTLVAGMTIPAIYIRPLSLKS
jgi:hypothetical protein